MRTTRPTTSESPRSSRRLGDDLWLHPFPAAAACLNGSGEIAGLAQVQEWGIAETPIFLTATTYVGAVYDAATQVLYAAQPRLGMDDVLIPVVAECDPCDYCDVRDGARPDVGLVAGGARGGGAAVRWRRGRLEPASACRASTWRAGWGPRRGLPGSSSSACSC